MAHAGAPLPLRTSPLFLAACIYTAALFVSSFVAADLPEALAEVIKWVELCAVLLIAPAMLAPRQTRWVAAALVAGALGQALLGLYQFIFQIGPEFFIVLGRFMRAYGTFAQPNPFGGFLGLTLPVALSLALWAWQTLVRQRGMRWAALGWALFFTLATAAVGAGLLASWSRGAWLGAGVSVMVVLVLHSRVVAVLTGLTALLVAAGLLLGALTPNLVPAPIAARVQDVPAYFGLTDVLNQPVTDENFSVIERVAHWVAAQRMWEQSPWLGIGPGNYAVVYPEVRLPKWEEPLGHAHNVYLNVLGETGLLGFTTFLVFHGDCSCLDVAAVPAGTAPRRRRSRMGGRTGGRSVGHAGASDAAQRCGQPVCAGHGTLSRPMVCATARWRQERRN
ncbi:MAG: O-antigen ligase family protein [Anaerolineales bacterium]|nr:O-antigen ligase family protein [Anaerolineales bacterium]